MEALVPYTRRHFEAKTPAEWVCDEAGRTQLHALEVVDLLQQRSLAFMDDNRIESMPANRRRQPDDTSPVPATFLVQKSSLEGDVAHSVGHLNRGTEATLAEHVAEQHRPTGTHKGSQGASAGAQIRLPDPFEPEPR